MSGVTKKQIYDALNLIKNTEPKDYEGQDLFDVVGLTKRTIFICLVCGLEKELTTNNFNKLRPPYWRYGLSKTSPCKKHTWGMK